MSNIPDPRDDHDDLKQALRSLAPRTSVDRGQLLTLVQADSQLPVTPASGDSPSAGHSRSNNWWPALTALSWLVTAFVWWNASQPVTPGASQSSGVMSAAVGSNDGAEAIQVGASQFDQHGQALDSGHLRSEFAPPVLVDAPSESASPLWLALFGIDIDRFTPLSAEERWAQLQEQAAAPRQLTSISTGERPPATYASLRDEFDTPIRRNWLER
jgi:hypothetical protein